MIGRRVQEEISMQGVLKQARDRFNVSVLLDTGAEKSFINENLIGYFPQLEPSPTRLCIHTLSELVHTTGIHHEFVFMSVRESVTCWAWM